LILIYRLRMLALEDLTQRDILCFPKAWTKWQLETCLWCGFTPTKLTEPQAQGSECCLVFQGTLGSLFFSAIRNLFYYFLYLIFLLYDKQH
jgi:hypothetical protein